MTRGARLFASSAALATVVFAAAGAAHAEKQMVFPQGAEQSLSALQDIDVIEHLGDRVPAGLAFTDVGGRPVQLESLFGRGLPVVVTLGYHRCPMLCGLVLDGIVKAAASSTFEPTHEQIAARAYELYLGRGSLDGYSEEDWLIAEAELRRVK